VHAHARERSSTSRVFGPVDRFDVIGTARATGK
jgi:hypothetical protein